MIRTVLPRASANRSLETEIPGTELDSVSSALLANIPHANLPGIAQNLLASEAQRIKSNNASAKLDHQFSANDTAFARFSLFDAREFDPFGSGVLQESLLPGFGRDLSTHSLNGVASLDARLLRRIPE